MKNKETRERKEMENLFKDPRSVRAAWRNVGLAILQSPATKPSSGSGRDGMDSYEDLVEQYSYRSLRRDIDTIGKGGEREPTELEMIFRCQAMHARHNPASATFIRDTVGAKPVDESKVEQTNYNMYETLTDEELELLQQHREHKLLEQSDSTSTSDDKTSGNGSAPLASSDNKE